MKRIPHAERPATRARWCTCACDDEGVREVWRVKHPDGTITGHYVTDPRCPIHARDAERSPF